MMIKHKKDGNVVKYEVYGNEIRFKDIQRLN